MSHDKFLNTPNYSTGYWVGESRAIAAPKTRPTQPLWNCMCQGCGAPLQRADLQCSYCLRATMASVPPQSPSADAVDLSVMFGVGFITPNEARVRLGLPKLSTHSRGPQ